MVTGGKVFYSWKTGEYKLLWWKIGRKNDENGGSGSFLLNNWDWVVFIETGWEWVVFHQKWLGGGCFC